jgi:hypothetical protein
MPFNSISILTSTSISFCTTRYAYSFHNIARTIKIMIIIRMIPMIFGSGSGSLSNISSIRLSTTNSGDRPMQRSFGWCCDVYDDIRIYICLLNLVWWYQIFSCELIGSRFIDLLIQWTDAHLPMTLIKAESNSVPFDRVWFSLTWHWYYHIVEELAEMTLIKDSATLQCLICEFSARTSLCHISASYVSSWEITAFILSVFSRFCDSPSVGSIERAIMTQNEQFVSSDQSAKPPIDKGSWNHIYTGSALKLWSV